MRMIKAPTLLTTGITQAESPIGLGQRKVTSAAVRGQRPQEMRVLSPDCVDDCDCSSNCDGFGQCECE